MRYTRTYRTGHEDGPATIWKSGVQIASGHLHAIIERETRVSWGGERANGQVEYFGRLTGLTSAIDGAGFEVHACGRVIPCSIRDGQVRPCGSINPPP